MKLPKRTPFFTLLACSLLGGAAYGWMHPVFRKITAALEEAPLTVIEPNGQDTNGDGIASSEEGRADIDGDGLFTQVEAAHFGMPSFTVWGHPITEELISDSVYVCNARCTFIQGIGKVCQRGQPSSVVCVGISGSSQCSHTTTCDPSRHTVCDCP